MTIIRDFAYDENDERFHGNYPKSITTTAKESAEDEEEMEEDAEDSDEEAGIDFNLWEWMWFYNNSKSRLTPTPPVLSLDDLNISVLPEIVNIFQSKANGENFTLTRMKTIFPFVKGTEYEMSLETMDELLIIRTGSMDHDQKPISVRSDQAGERWSSIDEVANDKQPVSKKNVCVSLEPPVDSFLKEIHQFLGYNKNYGDGWMTALKVKIVGNWSTGKATLHLVDLGLVPGNYCEA